MARSRLLLLLCLLVVIAADAAAVPAKPNADGSGSACRAKYRWQWLYALKDVDASKQQLPQLVSKWMREDCKQVLEHDHGFALADTPVKVGFGVSSASQEFAQYGGWSEWASPQDILACFRAGERSGNLQRMRSHARAFKRVAYKLSACVPHAPETVRFFFMYQLINGTANCQPSIDVRQRILRDSGVSGDQGCEVNAEAFADERNTGVNADFGGFSDFKSLADLEAYLKNTNGTPDRKLQRSLVKSSMRSVLGVPANPKCQGEGCRKLVKA